MNATTLSATTRVFISYKRNVEPDQPLASRIFDTLRNQGHAVFIDLTLTIGQEWARTIEGMVRQSDYLIVLLTVASSASEMVKGELEMAHDEAANTGKGPCILPVRVGCKGPLPYPISAWLDPLQYALWESESDTELILQELSAAITGVALSSGTKLPGTIVVRDSPPLYSAPLPSPGGALDADDPWYVRRISDDLACRTISQQGVTLVIKGSRQMGKTSLMVRAVNDALRNGKRCAVVDFQMLGKKSLTDSPTFFKRFGSALTDNLETSDIELS